MPRALKYQYNNWNTNNMEVGDQSEFQADDAQLQIIGNRKADRIYVKSHNELSLDMTDAIDFKLALETYSNKELYFRLIPQFEITASIPQMRRIAESVQEGNFLDMYLAAHGLRSAAGYAAASRIFNYCSLIEESYHCLKYTDMMKYYPDLLEHCEEFSLHWRMAHSTYNGAFFDPAKEDMKIPKAKGFTLTKVGEFEFEASWPEDYTAQAVEAEQRGMIYIRENPVRIIYTKNELNTDIKFKQEGAQSKNELDDADFTDIKEDQADIANRLYVPKFPNYPSLFHNNKM